MTGARSRRSGHVFEREVAAELRRLLPELAEQIRRGLQYGGAHRPDVDGVPGLWIECQFARRLTLPAKCRQAARDAMAAQDGSMPVVVFRQKGQPRSLPRFRVAIPLWSKEVWLGPPTHYSEVIGGLEVFLARYMKEKT